MALAVVAPGKAASGPLDRQRSPRPAVRRLGRGTLAAGERRNRRGASLMEVLVAVLVVAVGALGVARLQLESARNNRAALERTVAALLATDLAERWRTNPQGGYATALGRPPPPFVDCMARSCTPSELARFDLSAWKCALGRWREAAPCRAAGAAGVLPPPALAASLPAGDGSFAPQAGGMVVTVVWAGAEAGQLSLALRR